MPEALTYQILIWDIHEKEMICYSSQEEAIMGLLSLLK